MRVQTASFATLRFALVALLCACARQGQGEPCNTQGNDCQSSLTCVPIPGSTDLGTCCMPNLNAATRRVASLCAKTTTPERLTRQPTTPTPPAPRPQLTAPTPPWATPTRPPAAPRSANDARPAVGHDVHVLMGQIDVDSHRRLRRVVRAKERAHRKCHRRNATHIALLRRPARPVSKWGEIRRYCVPGRIIAGTTLAVSGQTPGWLTVSCASGGGGSSGATPSMRMVAPSC